MDLNKRELSAIAQIESSESTAEQVVTLDDCSLMVVGGGVGEVIFN